MGLQGNAMVARQEPPWGGRQPRNPNPSSGWMDGFGSRQLLWLWGGGGGEEGKRVVSLGAMEWKWRVGEWRVEADRTQQCSMDILFCNVDLWRSCNSATERRCVTVYYRLQCAVCSSFSTLCYVYSSSGLVNCGQRRKMRSGTEA